jgi:hypothetical protein
LCHANILYRSSTAATIIICYTIMADDVTSLINNIIVLE